MVECGKKAISKVIWVNGDVINMCPEHESQIRGLCQHMGWPITFVALGNEELTCQSKVEDKKDA